MIDSKEEEYSLDLFWEVDREIGELGGYNLPKNPLIILFPMVLSAALIDPYNMLQVKWL